jgi:hypothetical protein
VTGYVGFVKQLIIGTLVFWLLVGYPLYVWGSQELLIASMVSCLICAVNALVGGGIAWWAKGKGQSTFLKAVFGGMGIRVFIVLVLFFSVVKLAKLHVFSLTLSLFLFYILFQFLEIRFFATQSSGDSVEIREHK